MMKCACFERPVEFLYKNVVSKPRSDCTKSEQLVVTFLVGYIGLWKGLVGTLTAVQWFIYDSVIIRCTSVCPAHHHQRCQRASSRSWLPNRRFTATYWVRNILVYGTSLYLTASASAEFFADIALSPMEAVKILLRSASTLVEANPIHNDEVCLL
ncbi:uncharacterized protein [Asterias amurensis]|uniref:uncharacterized protein isoform X2 n=1 Tax=Asterias amurensis TaxID=7602 RepID=UPI003AB5BE7D